ncbi:MAG: hypothetical protein K2L45_09810 [Muribaculaceae bacterium]|nr:hypothetical protein [Muribaculaceae bacterium]
MSTIAIITGDIVDSTKLNLAERDIMINALQAIPEILSPFDRIYMEIFRGDSFQIRIHRADIAAKAAISIRAWLRSQIELSGKEPLDARIAIGIGSADYESDSLSTSDGEAFRLSGRLLDKMHKARLAVATPWPQVNEELRLSTAFVDDIISSWTQNQSKIMLLRLQTAKSHLELSQILDISRQMVDKSMKSSKEELIESYIDRFEKIIIEHNGKS